MAPPTNKVQKVMVQPINLIFRCLQSRSRIQIWLYENITHRIEGYIIGFYFIYTKIITIKNKYFGKIETQI
jgi:hypothetical protein